MFPNKNEEYDQMRQTGNRLSEEPPFDKDAVDRVAQETHEAVCEVVNWMTRGGTEELTFGTILGVLRALANLSADASDKGGQRNLSLAEDFNRSYRRTLIEVRERNGLV